MPSINRGTLPQNFLDSVSLGMRLVQPEPQYIFAKAGMAARLSTAALDIGASSARQFVDIVKGGGQIVPATLDEMARAADAYPGMVTSVDEFGKNAGDTVRLRRPVFEGGGYTEAARRVQPDKTTSTTGQSLKGEEVPVVLHEYEGPYNSTASEVQGYAIRNFDAKYKANRDQLASLTTLHLTRDYTKWLDCVIRDLFRATGYITYADDVANVLSFTAGGAHWISLETAMKARKALSDREWQPFPSGRYMLLVPTAFNVQMLGDPDYRQLSAAHAQDRNQLFGYITSVQDVDIFECTTLRTYAATEVVPGDGNAVPAGATVYEGLLLGPGAVGMGSAQNPEAFWGDNTDFGKVATVIWRSIQAFQTLDTRGVQRILFQA